MNEITIGDKMYISAKRAAEITGYARDYVGQLCREGHIDAKMVGRSWYVYEPSIRAHRFGDTGSAATGPSAHDLAAESEDTDQAEEVSNAAEAAPQAPEELVEASSARSETWQQPTYKSESFDMIPELPPQPAMPAAPAVEETLTDMQTAWKEWFERKQEQLHTPELESPEAMEAHAEAYEASEEESEEENMELEDDSEQESEIDSYEDDMEEDDENDEEGEEEVEIPLHRLENEPQGVVEEEEAYIDDTEAAEPIAIHHIRQVQQAQQMPQTRREEAFVPPVPAARVVRERVIRRKPQRSYAPVVALLIGVCIVTVTVAVIGSGFGTRYLGAFANENPVLKFLVGTSEFKR